MESSQENTAADYDFAKYKEECALECLRDLSDDSYNYGPNDEVHELPSPGMHKDGQHISRKFE